MKRIINCETGEVIERELNAEELAQQEIDSALATAKKAEVEAKAQAKQAILDRLGLTAEEFKTILS